MSPLKRFERLEPERRANILDVAAEEFASKGYDNASLNQIIAKSTLSKSSFYYYFHDKLDLFGAVLQFVFDPDRLFDWGTLYDARTPAELWQRFELAIAASMEHTSREPRLVALGQAISQLPEALRQEGSVGGFMAQFVERGTRVFTHGQEIGAVRTDLPIGVILELVTTVNFVVSRHIMGRWSESDGHERATLIATGVDAIRRVVGQRAPSD
ncbi:MAG: TetR/AcrR family transcriptional regulator [Myxococcota bacterium]